MATGNRLIFRGTRFLAAEIVDSLHTRSTDIFTFTHAHPRPWTVHEPQAFWRDFAEMDARSADDVRRFLRRRGDLTGGDNNSTEQWAAWNTLFHFAARGWDPPGSDGISRMTSDAKRLEEANRFLGGYDSYIRFAVTVVPDPDGGPGLAHEARTLVDFMVISASHALTERIAMRVCDHCGSWFEVGRRDALYCSHACRAAHSSKKGK